MDAASSPPDSAETDPERGVDAGLGHDAAAPANDAAASVDAGQNRDAAASIDASQIEDAALPMDAEGIVDAGPAMDAAVAADAAQVPGPCPPRVYGENCAFGDTSRQTREVDHLNVMEITRVRRADGLTRLQGAQLLQGFACDGIVMPATVPAAFDLIDENEVRVLVIERLDTGARFDWIRVFMGDTEVGFIFAQNTLDLVAYVSDGDLLGCTELRAPPPALTCPELHACLSNCDPGDIECRRPCIRATEEAALEVYIELDECAGECGEDLECLNRVCSEEWMACFGEAPPQP